jgi:hypothetical protein
MRFRKPQRLQQHRVEHREERRGGADAEGQRQHRDHGERAACRSDRIA